MKQLNYIFYIIIYFVFIFNNNCYSQITCMPGQSIQFNIENIIKTNNINNFISFDLINENPTVFFIDSIKINRDINIELQKNYYNINVNHFVTNKIDSPIVLNIYGTGLAGNDSITHLYFNNIIVDNNKENDTTITIILKPKNNLLNYAKIAKISNIYPNPTALNSKLFIEYSVDIPTDVTFNIYDNKGNIIENFNFYKDKIGRAIFNVELKNKIYEGKYWIVLKTKAGIHSYPFIILNQ